MWLELWSSCAVEDAGKTERYRRTTNQLIDFQFIAGLKTPMFLLIVFYYDLLFEYKLSKVSDCHCCLIKMGKVIDLGMTQFLF